MTDDPDEATPSDVLHLAQTALEKANRLDSELDALRGRTAAARVELTRLEEQLDDRRC